MGRAESRGPAALVLGTAGHIDHGKTALIRSLTGVDTDRLPEEKARGITIDLGFAPLELADGLRISVVDVPGHERLVRTMVSGATGIDLALLVVAADEGVMPQTREHIAICDLLGIERGVVALTKCDLVDDEMRELASEDARDALAATSLRDLPIVAVSSETGEGIEALRAAISTVASSAVERTPRTGPPRLAIDRVFSMRGFGAVVTGTLVGAPLEVGDNIEIHPSGLKARIRGLQTHGKSEDRVEPGARCAVNLQGVEVGDVRRGEVLSHPGALAATRVADARLLWLESAAGCEGVASVEFLVGTAERRARVARIGGKGFAPGESGFARIHIEDAPLAMLPGDRFIVRGFARSDRSGSTVGGGVILDVAPPHRRRSDPALVEELETLARRDPRSDIAERVRRSGYAGATRTDLIREIGLPRQELEQVLGALREAGALCSEDGELWLEAAWLERMQEQLLESLAAFHREEPLRPGMPRAALRGRLPDNVPAEASAMALGRLERSGSISFDGDLARMASHAPSLDAAASAAVERIEKESRSAGLEPPSPRDWAERLGLEGDRFRDLLAHLERKDVLIRAPGDLWFAREAVDSLRERVVAHLREHGEIDTQSYKALIGTTRRTAMPLMELLDEMHVTRRRGEVRILRGA